MARKDSSGEKKQSGIRRIISAYKLTRQYDKKVGLVCFAWFLGVALLVGAAFGGSSTRWRA
jgi:hypothetical protein